MAESVGRIKFRGGAVLVVAVAALVSLLMLGVVEGAGSILGFGLLAEGHVHVFLRAVSTLTLVVAAVRMVMWVRRLRRTVRIQESRLAAVAATSSDWMWEAYVAGDGARELKFSSCSPSLAGLLGWRPEDVVGKPMVDFVCTDQADQVRARLAAAIEEARGWENAEVCWRHADGRGIWMLGNAVPVLDAKGVVVGYRGSRHLAPADLDAQHRRAAIRERVQDLLAAGALSIAWQPIVSLESGRWVEVEALTRFADGRPPDVWFAEAHEVGLGVDLELAAVRAALRTMDQLPSGVTLAVNASPELVLDPRLAETVTAPGVPPRRIMIEMTEHTPVTGYDDIRRALAPLRAAGVRLAVDDTGAGYSSFGHVLALRPDVIKLDRSLIANIDADPARRAFVTAVALLALELGANLTGEGVETPEEFATLAALGVDHAQGYFLARPTTEQSQWQQWKRTTWATTVVTAEPLALLHN